jgi:hypothetical protein
VISTGLPESAGQKQGKAQVLLMRNRLRINLQVGLNYFVLIY